ncbi:hypothetical protein MTR67_017599 [Solanum verrucosum]|uniref:Gag-pol polyprotein n=1 Tax=Solanum verrucosum TaxID=315347 RepID=A0AAF0QQL0_SOLVR|nr:hypothetical protein MTR67_017599 [Solanum verrucosum]
MTTQDNREVIAPVNPNMGTTMIKIRDFTRMNHVEFHSSKVDENAQKFINEVYKIVGIMELSTVEKAELTTYQLKGVAQVWFNHWKEEREVDAGPLDWEKIK